MYKKLSIVLAVALIAIIGRSVYKYIKAGEQPIAVETPGLDAKNKWKDKHAPYADTVVVAEPGLKGYILTTSFPRNYTYGQYMIMDMAGNIIVEKKFESAIFDFRQWRIDGKTYYTYFYDDTAGYHNPKMKRKILTGPYVVLDSALNEIRKVNVVPEGDIKASQKQNLDGHDIIMLAENHFIVYCNYEKEVSNIPASLNPPPHKKIYAATIQEIKDGKVVWTWDASKYPEFYLNSVDQDSIAFSDSLPSNYLHMNSIVLDPNDSNLVVSLRCVNQIIKINRKTSDIMWRLGGKNSDFPILDHQRFMGQHFVKFLDDKKTIMLFDNGNKDVRPYTRILEFRLDEKNKKVTHFSAYKVPERFTPYKGSVQKVNGNLFITGGGYDDGFILLTEPTTDKYLFSLRTKNGQCFYRSYWVDNIYGLDKR